MFAIGTVTNFIERVSIPDRLVRIGINSLVGRTHRKLAREYNTDMNRAFARTIADLPIAMHIEDANAQHYEVPSAFFEHILGPQRKYSCCYYSTETTTLAAAEESALAQTVAHADLSDGQSILELGCGWGSLSLCMARNYPNAQIVAVSNSHSQRIFIEQQAEAYGLFNLNVMTADMNSFMPEQRFDRIVSVEMFEHMTNWRQLFGRIRSWLYADGRLFLHVFTHARVPYRFDHTDKADWIAQHFFTGGIMPSHTLIHEFADLFAVEKEWRWAGTHYQRTAQDWLANFDCKIESIRPILESTYGQSAPLWERRWRLFFLAVEGLFGYADGTAWSVSHYRLKPSA